MDGREYKPGTYISGKPLNDYIAVWKRKVCCGEPTKTPLRRNQASALAFLQKIRPLLSDQFTTLTLLRFKGFSNRAWAFTQMGRMTGWPISNPLSDVSGLRFGRLLGSGGGNGFGLQPNFGVYAWLAHWEDQASADNFFASHPWYLKTEYRTCDRATFFLLPTMTHGEWGGDKPFTPEPDAYDPSGPVAVITRATIRTQKLLDFWRYVPKTSASVYDQSARLFSIGVGEYPIFMQATFSVWTSGKAMQNFAYRSEHHKEVVKLTRERNWYKEEMFTRFQVLKMEGKWDGLEELI